MLVDIEARGWHYTPPVTDVRWSESHNGGVSASFRVDDPVVVGALAEDCPVTISDDDGTVLWDGAVAAGGLQMSRSGEAMEVHCVGGVEALSAAEWSLPYLVTDKSEWERETAKYRSSKRVQSAVTARPEDPPWESVVVSLDEGGQIYPGDQARMMWTGHLGSDMYVGAIRLFLKSGIATSNWRNRLVVGDQFYGNIPVTRSWSTTMETIHVRAGMAGWPMPSTVVPARADLWNVLTIVADYVGPTGQTAGDDSVWTAASYLYVAGQLVDEWGQNVPTVADGPLAHQVVRDLVGRCLRGVVDPARVETAVTDFRIDEMDYRDGVTPAQVLSDLEDVHTGHLWRVGQRDPGTGLRSLTWAEWSPDPRYVLPSTADVDLSGSDRQLASEVVVRWTDWKGRSRTFALTADPDRHPDAMGLTGTRRVTVRLDDAKTLSETAKRIANAVLDEVATRRLAGRATVSEPVLDRWTGEWVPAHRMRAGCLAVAPGGMPFRVTAVDAQPGSATLTLGRPFRTVDQIVAARGRRARR